MPKDFSHQNLRGKSFKGQDLTGANFSHADIRGISFKGAILKGANFANARCGVRIILIICLFLIYFISLGVCVSVIILLGILVLSMIQPFNLAIHSSDIKSFELLKGIIEMLINQYLIIILFLILLILSSYLYLEFSNKKQSLNFFRKIRIIIFSLFGTNFDGANLTDAIFSKANLKSCRFSKETIILRTSFQDAENLKFARLTGTILENKAVRELLVTGNGKNQSFKGMNLKGAYLVGADLSDADCQEADLIGATLENANLRDTNLSRIQALGVEFRGADFTGACLEAWNIDSTTQLDGANADYMYLLSNKLERRPASGNFGEGEFAKLFNEVLDTVDFIFRNGIDWQAFMISFDKLREKIRVESEDAEISIQSIANKGDGVFVIKVNVPPLMDKPEFHREFIRDYDNQLKLLEEKYKAQLEAKEDVITVYREQNINLLDIIKYQAQRPVAIRNIKTEIHGNVNNSSIIAGDENDVSG